MKQAKELIKISSWEKAIDNLECEIKDNPRNLEAHQLLLKCRKNQIFPGVNTDDISKIGLFMEEFRLHVKSGKDVDRYLFEAIRASSISSAYFPEDSYFLLGINGIINSEINSSSGCAGRGDICKEGDFKMGMSLLRIVAEKNTQYAKVERLISTDVHCDGE
jgi:hypothetical protein